MVFIEAQLS